MDEIKDFATLKAVVEDMQAKKDALGIKGVFASTSMAAGNQWRWQTHAVNVPLYQEFLDINPNESTITTGLAQKEIAFKYGKQFQNLMDLYTNNSLTAKTLLGSKTVDEAMAEFALGQCAMVQNGNWGASQILGVDGNKVASSDIKFLPIYTGIPGEEKMGLCVGTENYLCINKNASAEAQKGADIFLSWLFGSATGKKLVSTKLNFITPFNTFAENELPSDPLSQQVSIWMNKDGVSSVTWTFAAMTDVLMNFARKSCLSLMGRESRISSFCADVYVPSVVKNPKTNVIMRIAKPSISGNTFDIPASASEL